MKARYRRKCPEDCSYKDRRTSFCGFCMLDILERGKETKGMQMMIDKHDGFEVCLPNSSEAKPLNELVDELEEGTVLQITLEGMVLNNGQKTE